MREATHAGQLQEKRQLVGRVRSPAVRRIPRQQSLDLMIILDAAFQFGSHPTYSSVGKNTRGLDGTIKYL